MVIFEEKESLQDQAFKTYKTLFYETYRKLNPEMVAGDASKTLHFIRSKFPYWKHTMAQIMAISYHMFHLSQQTPLHIGDNEDRIISMKTSKYPYSMNHPAFNAAKAATFVEVVFKTFDTPKNKELIVIDVARYYEHLFDQS